MTRLRMQQIQKSLALHLRLQILKLLFSEDCVDNPPMAFPVRLLNHRKLLQFLEDSQALQMFPELVLRKSPGLGPPTRISDHVLKDREIHDRLAEIQSLREDSRIVVWSYLPCSQDVIVI